MEDKALTYELASEIVPTLLWVDDEVSVLETAKRSLKSTGFNFIGVSKLEDAREHIRSGRLAVIVADQKLDRGTGIELLEYAKAVSPASTRIILTAWTSDALVEEAINRASVFRYILKPWSEDELLTDLELAFQHHQRIVERYDLLKKIRAQNLRLEELNFNLEKIVYTRTQSEEESKKIAETNLLSLRETVRFIKDLSSAIGVEDILYRLSGDFRRFPSVRPPILGFIDAENRPVLYFLQGKQATEKRLEKKWKDGDAPRRNLTEDRAFLANVLGRPLAQLLIFPLKSPQQTFVFGSPVLFIEHSLNSEELTELESFLRQRIQTVSLALDRVLMESYLRLTSYQWEKTFDGFGDPVAIVDRSHGLVRANRSFSKMGDRSDKCYQTFANRESPCPGCPLVDDFSNSGLIERKLKNGSRIFQVMSYPISLSGETAPSNRVNHYLEVTDKVQLQERLMQNEKMSAIGLLAGNIAHELNNPLTGLRSLSQILLREVQTGSQIHGDLVEIETAAQRCEEIINNLLNFSQGGSEGRLSTVDLCEIVKKTLPFLKTAMRDHRTEIEFGEVPRYVSVEPHMMQQVIFNLLNNACQAMKSPGTLSVSVANAARSGWVSLSISDTGPGITEEDLPRIFDPFFTTKEEGEGTGLGLSMSRTIVERFGGEIHVETRVGKGTTFRVELPGSRKGET